MADMKENKRHGRAVSGMADAQVAHHRRTKRQRRLDGLTYGRRQTRKSFRIGEIS